MDPEATLKLAEEADSEEEALEAITTYYDWVAGGGFPIADAPARIMAVFIAHIDKANG